MFIFSVFLQSRRNGRRGLLRFVLYHTDGEPRHLAAEAVHAVEMLNDPDFDKALAVHPYLLPVWPVVTCGNSHAFLHVFVDHSSQGFVERAHAQLEGVVALRQLSVRQLNYSVYLHGVCI